ncbi:low temperature requirement protein A [Kribbella sp. NPDC026596]|uniref:low temperature requirement protein A n=1 Tax=Kribbella sp. NPDC026596 TaxID=3155122 RepID=UPI0033E2D9B1
MPDSGPAPSIRIRVRMTARPIDEPHRVSSQLELLFDLTFVVAVAAATEQFAHTIAEGHAADGLLLYLQVFFAIWWAWMNFTWFASSYDTDDVPYRLLTMVQMAGVLVLAAGVPSAADHGDYRTVVVGYVIMRLALVAQWLRASVEDPERRRTARRYALGISVLQVGWILRVYLGERDLLNESAQLAGFLILVALELSVPRWAERTSTTNWHPHHIAERYGLFTIILLGETILAATNAVRRALEATQVSAELITVAASGLVMVFALWWLYFLHPAGPGLANRREGSYRWGYGHYFIFAALGALGAGLEVAVEQTGHELHISPTGVSYAVAIPVAVFIGMLWIVHTFISSTPTLHLGAAIPAIVTLLLLPLGTPLVGSPVTIALLTATCVALAGIVSWLNAAEGLRQ